MTPEELNGILAQYSQYINDEDTNEAAYRTMVDEMIAEKN